MDTIMEIIRNYVGTPDFYREIDNRWTWDYGAMLEYAFACLLLVLVVSYAFRFIMKLFSR